MIIATFVLKMLTITKQQPQLDGFRIYPGTTTTRAGNEPSRAELGSARFGSASERAELGSARYFCEPENQARLGSVEARETH